MDFQHLSKAGIPRGPLDTEHTVWTLPSGRGKFHTSPMCADGLVERAVALTSITHRRTCTACVYTLTPGERSYLRWATFLAGALDLIVDVPDSPLAYVANWMIEAPYLQHAEPAWEDLNRWALRHAAPRLREAEALAFHGRDGRAALQDEARRFAAAHFARSGVVEHVLSRDRFPAVIAREPQVGSQQGDTGCIRAMLDRLKVRYAGENDRQHDLGVAVRAGMELLARGPSAPNQRPPQPAADLSPEALDALWREAAEANLVEIAREFYRLADGLSENLRDAEQHVVLVNFDPHRDPYIGDAYVAAHAVGQVESRHHGPLVVLHMPRLVWDVVQEYPRGCFGWSLQLGVRPENCTDDNVQSALDLLEAGIPVPAEDALMLARSAAL